MEYRGGMIVLLRFVIYTDQPISVILIGAQKGRFCAREWNFLQLVRRKGDSAHGRGGEWRKWRKGRDEEGFAALRAPRPFLLAGGALAKRLLSRSYAAEAAILFPPTTLQEQALDGSGRKQNQHRFRDANSLIINALRRGRDSNPRNLSVQQFSRLP